MLYFHPSQEKYGLLWHCNTSIQVFPTLLARQGNPELGGQRACNKQFCQKNGSWMRHEEQEEKRTGTRLGVRVQSKGRNKSNKSHYSTFPESCHYSVVSTCSESNHLHVSNLHLAALPTEAVNVQSFCCLNQQRSTLFTWKSRPTRDSNKYLHNCPWHKVFFPLKFVF